MVDIVHVEPELMVVLNVDRETSRNLIKLISAQIADEADIAFIDFLLLLLVSELCEGIDDDTEDEVQECDINDHEERQIKHISKRERIPIIIIARSPHAFSYTATAHKSLIKREEIALKQRGARILDIRCTSLVVHSAGVIRDIREVEREDRVDVDDHHA